MAVAPTAYLLKITASEFFGNSGERVSVEGFIIIFYVGKKVAAAKLFIIVCKAVVIGYTRAEAKVAYTRLVGEDALYYVAEITPEVLKI